MRLMGFYIGGHDSNVSVSDDDGCVRYFKLERIVQSKHKKGDVRWVRDVCDAIDFHPEVVCFSDGNRNGLGTCRVGQLAKAVEPVSGLFDVPTFCIDHHYAHLLSVWPVLSVPEKDVGRGVCIDGRGDNQVKYSVIDSPFNLASARVVHCDTEACFCLLLNRIGRLMGLSGGELDFAGKIMGAAAYGRVDDEYGRTCLAYLKMNRLEEVLSVPFRGFAVERLCQNRDQDFFDWIASFHSMLLGLVSDIFARYAYGIRHTVYAGGFSQNTVCNELLRGRFDVTIPPHGYDGGLSLGCIEYVALLYGQRLTARGFPFLQEGGDVGYASTGSISQVCDCLRDGKIVGWCQGRAEVGPRALGHRSILMNPAMRDCRRILNERVKKREFWRPFAGSLLIGDGPSVMSAGHECPYMLHAVSVAPQWRGRLPGIVHHDGTCRFQTVRRTPELETFCDLLERFKRQTGVSALLNTSYNLGGKPIANSKRDILDAFRGLDLDVLCVGDEILTKGRV